MTDKQKKDLEEILSQYLNDSKIESNPLIWVTSSYMTDNCAYVFPVDPEKPVEVKINVQTEEEFDLEKFEKELMEIYNGK